MIWAQLKLLLPSFAAYWVFLFFVISVGWFACLKSFGKAPFKWAIPFTISTVAVLIMIANVLLTTYQTLAIAQFQKTFGTQKEMVGAKADDEDKKMQKTKAEFLSVVEQMVQAPDKLTPEAKKNLFAKYAVLFTSPKDKEVYSQNIQSVFQCRRYFWEDALAAYQAQKVLKSEAREECEKVPGTFFGRDKLVGTADAQNNQETITKLAAHKRIPASEGKTVEVNERMIREALERQINMLEAARKLFDEAF